jgi:uncharacterized protein
VSNPRYPLRVNVGFLLNQPAGTSREITFDLLDFKLSPDFETTSLNGNIRITRTPQGVLGQVDFKANMPATCVRCLEDYIQSLHTNFTELFSYKSHPTIELGMVIPEDGNIDFAPLVREYLLLEVPIKLLCKEDCKGLCSVCGENLNQTTCEHQVKEKTGSQN